MSEQELQYPASAVERWIKERNQFLAELKEVQVDNAALYKVYKALYMDVACRVFISVDVLEKMHRLEALPIVALIGQAKVLRFLK